MPARLRSLFSLTLAVLFLAGAHAAPALPELKVALGNDPGTLDVAQWTEATPLFWALTDTVVGIDAKTGWWKPGLASSWTIKDGRTWTFTLRPARWSDGAPLTAADVAAAWRKNAAPLFRELSVLDAQHLVVRWNEVLPSPAVLASPRFAITDANRSSGPFRLASWVAGKELTVVKNPSYREASQVGFGKVTFVFTDSPNTAALLYHRRQVDWAPLGGGPRDPIPVPAGAVVSPGWALLWLSLKLDTPPLDNAAFRQRLQRGVERATLVKGLRGPVLLPFAGFVPRQGGGTVGAPPPKAAPALSPGLPGFTILSSTGETNHQLAAGAADQWSQRLGLGVDTRDELFSTFRDLRADGKFQASLSAWQGDYADPVAFLNVFRTGATANFGRYSNPRFDALLDELVTATGKEREKALASAEALLGDDLPAIPLAAFARVNLIDTRRWKGWYANPTDLHPWAGFGKAR